MDSNWWEHYTSVQKELEELQAEYNRSLIFHEEDRPKTFVRKAVAFLMLLNKNHEYLGGESTLQKAIVRFTAEGNEAEADLGLSALDTRFAEKIWDYTEYQGVRITVGLDIKDEENAESSKRALEQIRR